MNEPQSVEAQTDTQQQNKESKKKSRFLTLIRETLAVLFWLYIITKLFIFDFDIFLIEKLSPSYFWLINYKFFILIGVLATIWLVTKNRHILLWSLFVFFYPVIFLFWRIPVFVFKKKSWNLVFALIDSVISFFKSIKITFITTAFFLVSIAIIFGSSNKILLWISLVVLFAVHLSTYIQRILLVFKPSGVYEIYSKVFTFLGKTFRSPLASSNQAMTLDKNELELNIESMSEKQIEKWTTNVQQLVLINRVTLFTAKKLKTYQESRFNIFSSVFGILMLVIYTVFSFAVINYGLYKLNQHSFLFSNMPTFFNFIYYSFNNLLFNPIPEIIAKSPVSQTVSMIESLFALFLIGIFVSLVLSVRTQRETDELNAAIKDLKEEGTRIEGHLKDTYRLSNIEEAMEALKKLHVFLADFFYNISDMIK